MYIKLAKQDENLSIVNLLNETTQKLLSKKILQWKYPWDSKEVDEDILNGHQYTVKTDDKIMAIFSL